MNYLVRIGDGLSQVVNVLILNGHPNESMSGRAWRTNSAWYKVIDMMLWFDKDHCRSAYLNDIAYARRLLESLK